VEHPQTIRFATPVPGETATIEVVGGDGSTTLITLHHLTELPA
jgi:hypothetical protein